MKVKSDLVLTSSVGMLLRVLYLIFLLEGNAAFQLSVEARCVVYKWNRMSTFFVRSLICYVLPFLTR